MAATRRRRRAGGGGGRVRDTLASWNAVTGAAKPAKSIVIIAGPNGAGKTTFAREYLPHEASCPAFVNADLIAAGLAPFGPEAAAVRAGRIMLREIREHVRRGDSFAFETTLSGRAYARWIPMWRSLGYRVKLVFLALPNADMAVARVAARVRTGGHDVPEAVIRRRFVSGRAKFERVYRPLADSWTLYDNAGPCPVVLAEGARP